MASRQFADLSSYRQLVNAQKANQVSPLDALLQGGQQGLKLVNLPQTLQDQDLARQLNNAILSQKLQDLQNPEQALARKIQEELTIKSALNPELGIAQAAPGLAGETIANPSALTLEQQATLPTLAPEAPLPTAIPGTPDVPIRAFGKPTGLTFNAGAREKSLNEDLNRKIQLANSRAKSAGIQGQFIPDDTGRLVFVQKPTEAGGAPVSTRVASPEGGDLKVAPKGVGKAAGGMTPNQQASLLFKYGQVKDLVGPTDDPKLLDDKGNLDFNKLAVAVGNAERSQKINDLTTKEKSLNSAQKKEIGGFISAQKDLENLKAKVLELDSTEGEPGVIQNAFAVMANNPSEGFFSSLTRQFANSQLKESTRQKESVRAGLESAVTKALSGQAVSSGEAQRLTGLLPKADDPLKVLLTKLSGLEEFLNNRIEGTKEAAAGSSTPSAPAPTTNPNLPKIIKITPRAK